MRSSGQPIDLESNPHKKPETTVSPRSIGTSSSAGGYREANRMKESQSVLTALTPSTTLTTSQCSSASPFTIASTSGQIIPPPVSTTTSDSTNSTNFNNLSTLLNNQLAGNRLLSLSDKTPSFLPHIEDRKSPSNNNLLIDSGVPVSSGMPISLLSANRIFDNAFQQLSNASNENLGGKRNQDLGLKLKLRNPTAKKSNGHGYESGSASKSANESSMSKVASKVSNIINGLTNGMGNSVHDNTNENVKKTRKRPREKKEKEKGPRKPRGKAGLASLQNGETPGSEPVAKKTKLDNGVRQTCDQSTCTASVATFTEPDLIGPLEPGTPVTLEGIVWHESVTKGFVVVNVTWRGKTYMGTLMDCAQIEWAPPRHCDSPPSDLDCNRSPMKDKNLKRGRNGAMGVVEGGDYPSTTGQLRGGRNRRGANFQTPASPARSDISASGKRKGRVPNSLKNLGSLESKDNLMDLASPGDENKLKKGKRGGSGSSTPSAENTGQLLSSPALLECPEPNCSKKYKHPNGLRYHQQHQHGQISFDEEEKNMEFQSEFREDTSSNGEMSRVNSDNDASFTKSDFGRITGGEASESSSGASAKIDESPFEFPKEQIQKAQPATAGSNQASSFNAPASISPQPVPFQNQAAIPSTLTMKTEPEPVPALSAAPPIFALKSALESPSIFNYPSILSPVASILPVDSMHGNTTPIDAGPGPEEDSKSQKQRSKQRRKQPHPISSNQKKSTSSAAEEIVSPTEKRENLTNIPKTEAESIPDIDSSNRVNTSALAAPPLAKLDQELSKSNVLCVASHRVLTVPSTTLPLPHPSRPPPIDPTLPQLPVVSGSRQTSRSGKEKFLVTAEPARLQPPPASLDAVMGNATPLDLKISAPVRQTVMKSPSAPDNRKMQEQPKSPAYSDISDDNDDGQSEKDIEPPSMPTSITTSGPADKSPYPFPFFPQTPFLLSGTPEPDAKRGSPSDPQKKLMMGQFPPFMYGPVAGPRQGASNAPDGPFPSPFAKTPGDTIPQSQDTKLKPTAGHTSPLGPNSATKSRSSEGKPSKEPVENIRGEKSDAKCKSPSVKESSSSKGHTESKSEVAKSKEDTKGPVEDHGAMQHKALSAPQQHMFHPQYMNQMFRPGMQQPGFSPAAHPMFLNRPMYGPQDQLQMFNIAAMYGFANPGSGRPGPMPPGLPQLGGQDQASALEMLQQRLGPPGQPPHKIHELSGFLKPSSSSTSATLENQNPSSSPAEKKSADTSPKNNIGSSGSSGQDERFSKNKPDRSSASPLLRDHRNTLHPLHPATSAPYLNSPQMLHHMDPYQMLPGQRPPPLHLPSRNHN